MEYREGDLEGAGWQNIVTIHFTTLQSPVTDRTHWRKVGYERVGAACYIVVLKLKGRLMEHDPAALSEEAGRTT
jgi:hypothetical protein